MHKITILFFFFLLPFGHYAQTLKGKVYDAKGTLKNIKVHNKTQNRITLTNDEGEFSIVAKINDSILFQSLFYHNKIVVLKAIHFEEVFVFELKEILNELDEVEVKAEKEQPVFTEEGYNEDLKFMLQEDIKNNPHLYKPAGGNILALISLVGKLFKKNKKSKSSIYQPITYKQMDSLFKKSTFFNKELMTENLKIPENKKYLFYDFCDAKQISSELLKDENKMQFLEELVLNSQLFLILLDQYGEENVTKD